ADPSPRGRSPSAHLPIASPPPAPPARPAARAPPNPRPGRPGADASRDRPDPRPSPRRFPSERAHRVGPVRAARHRRHRHATRASSQRRMVGSQPHRNLLSALHPLGRRSGQATDRADGPPPGLRLSPTTGLQPLTRRDAGSSHPTGEGAMPDTTEPMSETNPTPDGGATPPAPETSPETDSTSAGLGDAGKRALEAERKAKREAERQLKQLQTELEQLRKERMSEQERAIADAVAQAKAEAAATYGSRLAAAEFRAAAAGRLSDEQVDTLISA